MKKAVINEKQKMKLNYLLTEDRASKNISFARRYIMSNGYNQEQAQQVIDSIRHDIPNVRLAQYKFILGVTRMYLTNQLQSGREIGELNKTLEYIASDAHVNEYNYDLNGEDYTTLTERFKGVAKSDLESDMAASNARQYTINENYTIVPIDNPGEAAKYGKYTSWCVTHNENMYNSCTHNGTGRFYFCLRKGFENEPKEKGEGCPLDSYGLSMIAVSVDMEGAVNTITSRWNHDMGGNDNIMSVEELEQVIGRNFYQTFKPYSREELHAKGVILFDEVQGLLDSGKNPKDIFNAVGHFYEGFARVRLNGKYNFINQKGRLISNQWFDNAGAFDGGFAEVELNYKWNYINQEGRLISNQWFDYLGDFENGFALVKLNGKWNFINQEGKLISNQWFDYTWGFNNGFARVTLNGKWNYINQEGRLISNQWFDNAGDFYEEFAIVELNNKWNYINQEGMLISNQWFDYADNFNGGFALVELNNKRNFINKEGKLISNQWFDDALWFNRGSARVKLNGKWLRLHSDGTLTESKNMPKTIYITEEQKKKLKKAIAAQDQVGGKVNAGIMDAVAGMCEEQKLNEWTDLTMELWEDDDCTHCNLLNEFLSDKQKGITKKQWNLIPKEQYWNLLKRYIFSPEMARIPRNIVFNWFRNIICKNTMQISYITDFAGHSQYFPDEDCHEVFGQEFNDYHEWSGYLERIGFYAWCVLPDGSDAWSDYGLQPLYKLIETYNENMSGEDILILINRCLDIGHQRGDLASAFIEGGSRTCSEISSWKCLEEGKNVPEKCDKCGGKVVLQIHGEPVYVCKDCGKYFGTRPFNLDENMEEKSEYELGIKKFGNSLPPDIHVMNEGKESKFNYEPYIKSLTDFMVDYGLKIRPFPDVTLINHNDDGVFVPTGNYSPDEKRIRVYTIGRHPKDVLRTFAHEMIHHMQNLRGDTDWGHGGDLEEDAILEQIEGEAYLLGNLVFRKWTEHIQHRTGGATVLKEGKEQELDELSTDEVDLSSFEVKDQLNPYFWKDGHLDSRIRMKLLDIADDFIETLGIDYDEAEDIIMTGSLANFNWSEEYSDIDLHVVVDFGALDGDPALLKDYFDAKRKIWNETHKDLRIYGFQVELYVQDASEIHASSGVYSIDKDKWLVEPNRDKLSMDDVNSEFVKEIVSQVTEQVDGLYDIFNATNDEYKIRKIGELAKDLFNVIKQERRGSLQKGEKEMVNGNIIFKTLRRNGYIEKLINLINDVYDKANSL